MKSVKFALLLAALASAIVSCSDKDDDNLINDLEGEYTFVDVKAENLSRVSYYLEGSNAFFALDSISAYASTKANGSVSITANSLNSNKLAYSIAGTLTSRQVSYPAENPDMITIKPDMTKEVALNMDFPEASSTSAYKQVSADSIYFTSGFVVSPILGSTPTDPQACGAHYKWSGDTLIITSYMDVKNSVATSIKRATVITRLKKK